MINIYMKRREAKLAGLEKYSTGKPCKNGHMAERYTVNGTCVECRKEIAKRNVATRRLSTNNYYNKHKNEINQKKREKYNLNKK